MSSTRAASSARPGLRQPTKRASTLTRHMSGIPSSSSSSSSAALAARIGRGGAVSPAESLASVMTAGTKRKEREFDMEAGATAANSGGGGGGGEETNINVVVRCRGRNEREVRENSAVVATTDGAMGKTVELSMGPNALSNKTYSFDRVFSPAADQSMIFDDVVKPILDQMVAGFNCTIFAYGQTGTGKTYTMSGDMTETLGLLTDAAGIIPRVLQALFQKLGTDGSSPTSMPPSMPHSSSTSSSSAPAPSSSSTSVSSTPPTPDSIVRCSFIELYNEELRDLLSADADGGSGSGSGAKLKIYEDNSRKGHATTVVQGMEERHIGSAAEGIKRLQEGSIRRQVAATKCNDLSSRSHTVFTITVQSKHVADNGEDFYITGKLNLVDLAGSENIQRSGAENKRAAEAGLINKSLLTLGRVINALVDRTAHVPYRESKLTRLLQDSLGGRTKTCIIATVSTAKSNLEETISTLDYAFRAKNIRNKPQVNQLVNKKTLLRELAADIERLKSELIVTRQRNGVYLSNEAYEDMTVQSESRRILAEEQAARIETMENSLRHKLQELLDLTSGFMGLKKDHEGARARLDETRDVLGQTEHVLAATRRALAEETLVRQAHQATEQRLAALGGELVATLGRTVDDIDGLRAKNRRKSDLQGVNRNTWAGAQAQVSEVTRLVEGRIRDMHREQDGHIAAVAERLLTFVRDGQQGLSATQAALDENLAAFETSKGGLLAQQAAAREDVDEVLDEIRVVREHIQQQVGESLQSIASAAERIAEDVVSELSTFHNQLRSSYSTLGRECKNMFEDLLKHLNAQRSESDSLRRQVEAASQAAIQSNATVAALSAEAVEEERRAAAEDRQRLLSQIGSLISAQAEIQEARLAAKADVIRERTVQAGQFLEEGVTTYSRGMDAWTATAGGFIQDVGRSRDVLKSRLQDDWAAADSHSTSIQDTARSVHAETVRVVEEQKTDLDVQMQGLDSLVAKAAVRNGEHLARHSEAVAKVAETVTSCVSDMSSRAQDAHSQTEELGAVVGESLDGLRDSLAPVEETLAQPLVGLRALVGSTSLREYVPTGDTPEKIKYEIPLDLPRTAARHVIIAGLHGEEREKGKRKGDENHGDDDDADGNVDDDDGDDDDHDDDQNNDSNVDLLGLSLPTPSKSAPAIFADLDQGGLGQDIHSSLGTSLREVNPNVSAGSILFDPGATSAGPAPSFQGTSIPVSTEGKDGFSNNSSSKNSSSTSNNNNNSNKIPLSRRSMRQPPHKQAKTKSSMVSLLEGRENLPPAVFAQSASRRRSPRLN